MGLMEKYNEQKKKQGINSASSRKGLMERYNEQKKDLNVDNTQIAVDNQLDKELVAFNKYAVDKKTDIEGINKNTTLPKAKFMAAPEKSFWGKIVNSVDAFLDEYLPSGSNIDKLYDKSKGYTNKGSWTEDQIAQIAVNALNETDSVDSRNYAMVNEAYERLSASDKYKDSDIVSALSEAKKSWQASPGTALGKNVKAAVTGMGADIASFANSLGADKIPGVGQFTNAAVEGGKAAREEAARYNKGKYGEDVGNFTQGVVNLVPYFLLGPGKSVADTALNAPKYAKYIAPIVKNPSFWYSLTSMWGGKYQEAIDGGASENAALANAILYAVPAALVEVGGGIGSQDMGTQKLSHTILEEIGEELAQDVIGGISDKATVNPQLPIWSTEENAVINPFNMAKTALATAPIVAVAGGANRAVNKAAMAYGKKQNENKVLKVVREYKNAVDENLVNFVQEAKNNTTDNKSIFRLNNVNERMAGEIEGLTGIDAKNYGNVIKANSIRHIIKDHGVNGETDSSMADDADIARIQYVIDNYDTMELLEDKSKEYRDKNQKPAPMIKISKRVNGTYYVVEAVPDTNRQELAVVTAYKNKATEQQTRDANSPHSDARNASADVTFNSSIAQEVNGVNRYVLGEKGQKALAANFREGQNENDYAQGFRRMYNLGQSNVPLEKASAEIKGNKYIQSLSPDQRMAAYYSGQNDAKAQLEAEKNDVKYVEYYSDAAGVVENDAVKKVDAEELKAIDKLARAVGAQVVFEEDIEGMNGFIELGKIHISLNAENKLAVVAAHEVTHRMQELAPESYRKYRDFVMASVGVDMVENYQKKLNEKDIYLSDSEVMDEIAADYTKKMLADPQSMQKFIDDALNGKVDTTTSIAENRTILERLFDSIKEFIKRISEKFSGRKAEQNQAARDAYGVDFETLKQAKNLLQKALKDSADVVSQLEKQGAKGKAEIKGKKKFSVKMNGKEEVVFERSFSEQVSEVLSKDADITDGNHVFVCETPSILKQLGFPDLPMLISKGHLRDMNHEEVEGISKYHGLSELEINKIPFILENPAIVFRTISDKNTDAICILSNVLDSKHRPMLISIKPNGKGRYNEVRLESNFILSAYGRNNAQGYLEQIADKSENVMYINKKRTQEMLKGARLQLPAGLSNLRSDIIIHKIDNNVNTQSMQKSKNNSQRKNSVKMDEDLLKQNEQLKKAYSLLSSEFSRLKNQKKTFRKDKIATVTKKILNDFDFAYNSELLSRQMEGLAEDTKQMIAGNMDMDTFKRKVFDVAKDVVESGTRSDSLAYTESKAMRDYLRTTKITLSEDARNNLGDEYETIRKSAFGRLRLAKEGGIPLDIAYQELSELYPEYFSTETETNAAAQLRQIQSVLDGLQSLKSDAFGGYTDDAAEWLSGLMIDQIYNEVFVSGEAGKTTVSVDIKAMRNEMADNLQKIMNRERSWREREYNKLQKQFEKKTKNYTESRQKAVKIKQIKLHTERLSKALIDPSERFAVPEDLKKPVAKFLSCINLENDRLGEKTMETLSTLMRTYRQIAEQEYELGMVLDPQLIYNIEDISETVEKMDIEEKRVSDLDLVTLEKLRTSIMSMETMLRNYNQTFRDGNRKRIDELASNACEEIKERAKGIKKNSKIGAVRGFSNILNFDMLNPWDYFHQMGGTFEELFGELREGENRQIKNLAKGKVYLEEMTGKYGITKKDMADKSLRTFKLANGETVELTKAQVMSLYLLWRQNQTHEHITEGGIRPGKVTQKLIENKDGESKIKMSVSEDYNKVRPALDDIATILDTLSDNEKKFAESISNFFVDECAEWGNEVALKLYGYKKFNTTNYFPIVSDKMYLQEEFGVSADSTIKNMGITKKRIKHANNPIIIEDIFDVYARHVSDMAKYNAYVLPLQDIQRVFNSRNLDGDNNVKALVATKFGRQAVDYFSKLMVDINMGINNQYGNAVSSALISKYKQAKMGLNARVVVQQPMSYVRAAALIDTKYLTGAMGKKVNIETVFKYSPIAQWKSWGFFSTDTGKDMYSLMTGEKELADYTMALAGKADEMTWKRIWAAVELETADLHSDLQKGSEKFYEVCGKRFDEIIDRTQVVDSTLHRSQALRSPDGMTKMVYSFMSEPLKTYNLLRSAVVDAISKKDAKSKLALAKTVGVCAVSAILLACVTGAFDTLTGDDEEEFRENFKDNLVGDALGMLPYVKDAYSVIQGFTVERMDMQGLSDVANAILMIPKEQYTWRYKTAHLISKIAELRGVPVGSFKKSVYDLVLKNVFKGTENFLVPYNMAKQMYHVDGMKKGEFINILFDAYSAGNKKHYNKIFKDMIKEGLDAKTIESGMNSRFEKSGIRETFAVPWTKPYSITTEENEDKFGLKDLTASQYQNYQSNVTALEKDIVGDLGRMRNGLSEEEYQKRLKAAYEYSTETALEKVAREKYESDKPWINKAQTAEERYGLEPAEFIMFYKYFSELTPPAGREKFKTNEKKNLIIDYLNGMELTREEWNYLYREVAGYKK